MMQHDALAGTATADRACASSSIERDRLLQLSRRVDWRFLLGDPHPARVVVMGDPDEELGDALARFVGPLKTAAPGESGDHDLVVVTGREVDWDAARSALSPGGTVFVEARAGALGPDLPGIRGRAERVGLCDVVFHWHRPSFGGCLEIVPIEEETVVDWVLGRRPQNARGGVRLFALRVARALGLLRLAWSSYSVLARRPGEPR